MTSSLASLIPPARRGQALSAIKAFHTAVFFSIAGAILLGVWDGLRGGPRRRTAVAGGMVLAETAVFVSNNQVCPLTPLAEQLGPGRGSVVDVFLPTWVARRIPVVAGSAAVLALALNLSAWRGRSDDARAGKRSRGHSRLDAAAGAQRPLPPPRWCGPLRQGRPTTRRPRPRPGRCALQRGSPLWCGPQPRRDRCDAPSPTTRPGLPVALLRGR